MNDRDVVEKTLLLWKNSLPASVEVSGLTSRNPSAYKWKALFRAWILRETVFWRLHDLLTQSCDLYQREHGLGARILLRSAFETLATLIYLNQNIRQVLDGKLDFHDFCQETSVLLLGSRNGEYGPGSRNIITILNKCDKKYPGLISLYADLSESAHPSFEGLCMGYSTIIRGEQEAVFSNRWMDRCGEPHLGTTRLCMEMFQHEYDEVWTELMVQLESWVEANDDELEVTKDNPLA